MLFVVKRRVPDRCKSRAAIWVGNAAISLFCQGQFLGATMRIAVIGSGGLGGYFGARLAQGGADVRFLARGAHLAAMRADGLAIEGRLEVIRVAPVRASDDPADLGVADFVLLAVKLWDTEKVLEQIKPVVGPGTTLISFQNGVLKDEALRTAYGTAQIMGGVGYVATALDRPGVIRQTGPMQRLIFGEFDGRRSTRAEALLDACLKGGINAELSTNILREIWEKYVFLVGLSGTTTAMRSVIGRSARKRRRERSCSTSCGRSSRSETLTVWILRRIMPSGVSRSRMTWRTT